MLNVMKVETFGQRLKRFRVATGKSQRQIARETGLSNGTISQAENDALWVGQTPSTDIVRRLAKAVGVTLDELAPDPDSNAPQSEPLPEIQTVPLLVLLKRIGATPYRGRPVEGIAASAGSGADSHIPAGFDDARPRNKRRDPHDPLQDVEVAGECMVDLLYPGDVVTVDTSQMPQIGEVVVGVRFHDEMIVKFLRMQGEQQYLESKDGTTIIPLDQYIRLLGPVRYVQKSMQRLLAGY